MDIVNNFKNHLALAKNKPSKVTIKNYVSDVRKFLQWYEKTYNSPFNPILLRPEVITRFQSGINGSQTSAPAARSSKRYISSLRKFARFLVDSGAIKANPFDQPVIAQVAEDPWQLKGFKNYLYTQKSSNLTIKNYIIDIKQFVTWLEKVTDDSSELTEESHVRKLQGNRDRFLQIDTDTIELYKERLLGDGKFSPTSINRKLSSLRRYIRWLTDRGLLSTSTKVKDVTPDAAPEKVIELPAPVAITHALPLTALHELSKHEQPKEKKGYSKFAPIRLFQKTSKIIGVGLGTLLINPAMQSIETIQYALWKRSGKKIFAPVTTILEAADAVHSLPETIGPEAAGTLTILGAKAASLMASASRIKSVAKPYAIRNISKSFYAPLKISLKQLPWHKRMIHHLRYTRPAWYKKYHTYPYVHQLHLAILILGFTAAALGSYYVITQSPLPKRAVLAASATAPSRTLAFQGRLLDKTNTPITAETHLRFAIYNSPTSSGAAQLWQERQTITPNSDGYFSAKLGKIARLNQQVFTDNPSLYVGISIEGDTELKPRQQLPTVGYASNAQALEGLKAITKTNETQNVVLALDSSGDLTIGGSSSPTFRANGGRFGLSGQSILITTNPGSNGNIEIAPDGSGIIDLQKPLQNTTNSIGASGIAGAIDINDVLAVTTATSSQSAFTVKQNSTGDIISAIGNGIAKFRLDTTGRGIFAGNLEVNGNTITTTSNTFAIANTNVGSLSIGNSATTISLGGIAGTTTVNNNLNVTGKTTLKGELTTTGALNANGGIVIGSGKTLALSDFTSGAIPFINDSHELAQDAASFSWVPTTKTLNVVGSLCLKSSAGACAGSAAGTIYASNATVQAADLAENYTSAQTLEPGDVVIPEGLGNTVAVVKATGAYQPQVIGIISTKPGFTLNSDAQADSTHPHVYPLALQGRVPVKVSTINGPIHAGDAITSSSIPGVAMKATLTGQTIAKALEDYNNSDPNSVSKIMAFVNISYQTSSSYITDKGDLSTASNAASSISLQDKKSDTITNRPLLESMLQDLTNGVISLQTLSTNSLRVATEDVWIGGKQLQAYIADLVKTNIGSYIGLGNTSNQKDAITSDTASASASLTLPTQVASSGALLKPSATSSATLTHDASAAGSFRGIYNSIATPSATPTLTPSPTPSLTPVQAGTTSEALQSDLLNANPQAFVKSITGVTELDLEKLDTKEATVSNTLSVLGRTTLTDVGITGKVTIGLVNIDGVDSKGFASITTAAGPLKFQSDGFNGVDFLNGKVAIDASGNLNVNGNATFAKDVTIRGKLAANIIAPIPGSDLEIQNSQGKKVIQVTQKGDVQASGSGQFANINIVRGAQADTSTTQTQAQGSAGKGMIKANQTQRTIFTPFVTKQSLIYVTATSDTQAMTPYIARQTANGPKASSFTVEIPHNVKKDITFNWWIVN